jgi:hypothetical protein
MIKIEAISTAAKAQFNQHPFQVSEWKIHATDTANWTPTLKPWRVR